MRTLVLAFAMAVMLLSAGCSDLLSVHPLATPETVVFDAWLTGDWSCVSGSKGSMGPSFEGGVALIRAGSGQKDYDIVWRADQGEALRLKGHLVRVGDRVVFDLIAVKETVLAVPAHFFMLVEKTADGVNFHWLDSGWLRTQASSKDGLARVMDPDGEDGSPVVITAGSAELNTFLATFGVDPQAASGHLSFKRVKGT